MVVKRQGTPNKEQTNFSPPLMGEHGAVKVDPAIERFNRMREEAYRNFRWTKTTVRTAVVGFVVFPTFLYYLSQAGHHRWDWTAKRKGESLRVFTKRD